MEKELHLTKEQVKSINKDLRYALRNGLLPLGGRMSMREDIAGSCMRSVWKLAGNLK